ncbi:MAG: aldo/keto reductase, partial [Candidatus Gastranaerophilales bacterium]|nr:aldo/keto reductase [Candidatus Gastranaerophilales bacterium]
LVMIFFTTSVNAKEIKNNVPNVTLNNNVTMPQLGFGTWTLKGDIATKCVKQAIKSGYRLVDTAQAYGNEAEVYQGIKDSGIDRKDIFITTKISPDNMRNHVVKESLDKSIENLGGEYIDLVLIHWPVDSEIEQTWEIMEEYVKAGKIHSIGISNFNPHHIDDLLKYAKIKPVINQIEIHPYMAQQEVAGYTFNKEIQVEAWSPLGSGTILDNKTIAKIAKAHKKSIAQIILRWDIQRGLITIPRAENSNYIKENIDIFNFELTPVEMSIINGLNKNQRVNPKNDPDKFPW